MSPPTPDDREAIYQAEVARFRAVLSRGRSANQLALFELLVARSADERPPKEIEIAVALFDQDTTAGSGIDSGVRVYAHRLRKRMEDYYGQTSGPRLVIPKGSYRIVLEQADVPQQAPRSRPWPDWRKALRRIDLPAVLGFAFLITAGVGLAAWLLWPTTQAPTTTEPTLASKMMIRAAASPFRPVIAIGDSMLLAKSDDQRSVRRLILKPAVRTRDDFSAYLKLHPDEFYKLYDFNLHVAPVRAVEAGWAVSDIIGAGTGADAPPVRIMPVSALTDELLSTRDIVFVGRLSRLGVLKTDAFARSHFTLVADDRLTDSKTGKTYTAALYENPRLTRSTDYGFLSIGTGSSGQRLILLAGLGDKGSAAVVTLLRSPPALAELRHTVGDSAHFEALFAITHVTGSAFHYRLIAANPLP